MRELGHCGTSGESETKQGEGVSETSGCAVIGGLGLIPQIKFWILPLLPGVSKKTDKILISYKFHFNLNYGRKPLVYYKVHFSFFYNINKYIVHFYGV